jgi:acetyl-CoA acetyltransferase
VHDTGETAALLRGKAAITALGVTEQGELPGWTANQIAVEAFRLALEEAQLDKAQVDGLITCRAYGDAGIDTDIGKMAGINPAYSATLDYGTCNFSLQLAVMAIATGMATCVAIMYGTNQRTAGNRFTVSPIDPRLTEPYGFFNVATVGAMAFRHHQARYGTREDQLGMIAVAQREWARMNPQAIFTKPLTIDDYMGMPYLVRPLRRPDMTMISDGGACLIVTRADRVDEFPTTPVYVLGMAQHAALREYQNPDHFARGWIKEVAGRVYTNAGVQRTDVDALYIQDPFSMWVLQMLEWYGFCGEGEAGPFLEEGNTRPGGSLPVNTNGGQLSEAYMWGWLHLCEAVRQLRGEAGPRQVAGARIAQHASTYSTRKAASTILGRDLP